MPFSPHDPPTRVASLAALYPARSLAAEAGRWADLERAMRADFPEGDLRFYSAPGRTELGGNHTDHNHGRVLAAAVDLDCIAAVHPRADLKVRVASAGYDSFELDLSDLSPRPGEEGTTASLVRGAAAWMKERHDARLRGFEAKIASSVLSGSGLSSSAAVEVLFGTILSDLAGLTLSRVEIARIGQFAENRYFGKPCGLMDQTASAVGGITAIDFGDPDAPEVRRIDFDFAAAGLSLAVVDTGGSHADLTPEYAAIPAEMKAVAAFLGRPWLRGVSRDELSASAARIREACGDRAFLRAWHFAGEDRRAAGMAAALVAGDLGRYLALVRESGDSSWRFLQNLSPATRPREQGPALALTLAESALAESAPGESALARSALVESAPGGSGAFRVHGGGFAGTVQLYVPHGKMDAVKAALEPVFGRGCVMEISVRPVGAAIVAPDAVRMGART